MIKELFKFEIFYQLKQKAFPIFSVIFLLYGLLVSRQGFAPNNVDFNSPYQIAYFTSLFTLGSVFFIIFFTVSGVMREKQYNMENIIYSTRLAKLNYFISRFSGIFVFSLITMTMFMVGYALGTQGSNLDPTRLSDFNFLVYLHIWLLIVLPNVFVCSSIIFSVGLLTKNNLAVYSSAVIIYMLYMVTSIFLNSPLMAQSVPATPEGMALAAIADPFGISAFFEQTQFWTPFEKNSSLIVFTGNMFLNRLVWIIISLAILYTTYSRFSFRVVSKKIKKVKPFTEEVPDKKKYFITVVTNDLLTQLNSLYSLIKMELKAVLKSLPFIAILAGWTFILFIDFYSRIHEGGAYRDSIYPLTNILLQIINEPLFLFSLILIVFYSGEIIWRERNYQINEIIDSLPVSNWVFFISKYSAILLLPVIVIINAIIISIGFQISDGYYNFEPKLYLSLFYINAVKLYVYIFIAIFFQTVSRNKFLGMGFTIIFILMISSFITPYIGLEHPLLNLTHLRIPPYTNMTGFIFQSDKFEHLSRYWLSFGLVLGVLSFHFWQRGIAVSFVGKLKQFKNEFNKIYGTIVVIVLVGFIVSGTRVYYNVNVENDYKTIEENIDERELYERKYKKYDSLERLSHVDMKTEVDFYPDKNSYKVSAEHKLTNRSDKTIDKILLTERVELKSIDISAAKLLETDDELGTYLFQFTGPVQPGDTIMFKYTIDKSLKGYESDKHIVKNGTYLMHRDIEPYLKYKSGMEITDRFEREKRGLPERENEKVTDSHLHSHKSSLGRVSYETVISTSAGETAIGVGKLVKKWREGDRNYFHYKAEKKILPTVGYFSSNYKTEVRNYKGVTIEQYYYPEHKQNIDLIFESVKQTLDYCSKNFGTYPHSYIRIAEVPSHWQFGGFAHPAVISMVEDRLYLVDVRDAEAFNLVAKRTIHEVAHQWWGHLLVPKIIEGGTIFVEGLAKYTEAVLMEKIYGRGAVRQLSETARYRYFSGRAFASENEPPLYKMNGQSYLAYGKSYTVMLGLADLLGEAKVNSVLKKLTEKFGGKDKFEITSLDFLEELYKVSPVESHSIIDDWFKRIVTYKLRAVKSNYKKLPDDKYEVTINISAEKFLTNDDGSQTGIEINEPITIGLYNTHPANVKSNDDIIYSVHKQVNKNIMEFKFIVNSLPEYAGIDAFGTRCDENLEDNVIMIEKSE